MQSSQLQEQAAALRQDAINVGISVEEANKRLEAVLTNPNPDPNPKRLEAVRTHPLTLNLVLAGTLIDLRYC